MNNHLLNQRSALAFVLLLTLAACGSDNNPSGTADPINTDPVTGDRTGDEGSPAPSPEAGDGQPDSNDPENPPENGGGQESGGNGGDTSPGDEQDPGDGEPGTTPPPPTPPTPEPPITSDPFNGPGCNRFANGDFETGDQQWTGTATREVTSSAWLGRHALTIRDGWIRQWLDAPPAGAQFVMRGKYHSDPDDLGVDSFVGIGVDYLDASGEQISQTFLEFDAFDKAGLSIHRRNSAYPAESADQFDSFEHRTQVVTGAHQMRVWAYASDGRELTLDQLSFVRNDCAASDDGSAPGPFELGPPKQLASSTTPLVCTTLAGPNDSSWGAPTTTTFTSRVEVTDGVVTAGPCVLPTREDSLAQISAPFGNVFTDYYELAAEPEQNPGRTFAHRSSSPDGDNNYTRISVDAQGHFASCQHSRNPTRRYFESTTCERN